MPDLDLTKPVTREAVEAAILWDRFPYNRIPAEQRPIVISYHHAIAGIEECFDHLDGDMIRTCSQDAAEGKPWATPRGEADRFVTGHFKMLGTWHDALDTLDSELRGDVVAGGLPEWAEKLIKLEAFGLFGASYALLRAVAEYHHGVAGPKLSHDYDFAYELSNSIVNPFT
jgi:hypothetical protein